MEFLKKELSKLYISEGLFKVLRRQLYTLWLEKNKVVSKQRKELKVKIEKLEDERGDLYAKKLAEGINQREIALAIDSTEKKLEKWNEELDLLIEKHDEDFEKAWQYLQVLRDAKELLNPQVQFEPKKRLLLSLCSNLTFFKDKIEIIWQKPFDKLVKKGIDGNAKNPSGLKKGGGSSFGSPDWIRTSDLPVNSRLLYR